MATELTLVNLATESTAGARSYCGIMFADVPTAGDRVTVYSGPDKDQYDFWYVADEDVDYETEVAIGSSALETANNTVYAINKRQNLDCTATVYSHGYYGASVYHNNPGTMFNLTTLKSGTNISVTGFTGGTDGYSSTDRTKTAKRYVAIVKKSDAGTFSWDYSGYLGRFKFTDGLSLNVLENVLDWQDINRLNTIFGGSIHAYQLSYTEYNDTVSNIRSAIEGA